MYARRVLRSTPPLAVSGLIAAGLVLVAREYLGYDGLVEDVSAWGSWCNVFGVVYAIIAGFLLLTVLNRYSALNQAIEDELNAIECIRDFLVYLHPEQREARAGVLRALRTYVHSVSTTEWAEMSSPGANVNSDTSEELYEIMRRGKRIEVRTASDGVVLSSLMENISDVTRMRTKRIAVANERLPPRLRILLVSMSLFLVLAFALLGVRGLATHLLIAVSIALCVHLLYMIIEDLDHPFYGVWNLSRAPLEELVARFDAEIGGEETAGDSAGEGASGA